MKKLFIAIVAIAAAAACSNVETVSMDKGEAIAFGNAFVGNSTRADAATDPSYSTSGKGVALTQFNVYGAVGGVNIFNGNTVSKGDAGYSAVWALTGTQQYWINGANYKFVGVVDGSKTGVTSIDFDDADLPEAINYTVDGKTDLLCDVVVREADDDGNTNTDIVAFNFTHLLSKVKFSVKNTSTATNYRFVLTSAKLTNVYKSGVYGVDADTWTPDATMLGYTLENLTINSNSTQYHSQEVLLIPGSAVGVYVAADIEASDDNGQTWTKVSDVEKTFTNVVTLAKATAYHFIVELNIGAPIQFTAKTMSEWTDGDGDDDTPLN